MSSNRRNFLKGVAAAGGTAAAAGTLSASTGAASAATGESHGGKGELPFRLIWEGEWNDVPCSDYPLTPERWAKEALAPLVNTHVDALAYNVCSSDGYVAQLEHGELLLDNVEQFEDAWYWRYRENTKGLIKAGANPPDLAVKYGEKYGMKIFAVIRMNDPHDQIYAFRHEVSNFKRNHPEYLLGNPHWEVGDRAQKEYAPDTMESFTWGLFDYSHKAVRDHKLAIINEFATRWDNDGVMLDFERDPMYFWPPQGGGAKPENQKKMTDLIRSIRATLDKVQAQRGKKQLLMVRGVANLQLCQERGLDIPTWVKEGLVQVVIPGAGYAPFTLNLKPWLELVEGKECWIYPSNNHWKQTDVTRAWALQMLDEGAHGLYLFNWGHLIFGYRAAESPLVPVGSNWRGQAYSVWYDEAPPDYYTTLHEIGDIRAVQFKNKRYVLDSISHEVMKDRPRGGKIGSRLYRGLDDVVLPVELSVGRHEVPFRIADGLQSAQEYGFEPKATLTMMIVNHTHPDRFTVTLNDTLLNDDTRSSRDVYIMNNFSRVQYPIPLEALNHGKNTLKLHMIKTNPQMRPDPVLQNVDIAIDYV